MSIFEIFRPKSKKTEANFKTPDTDLRSVEGGEIKPLMEIRSDLRTQERSAYQATPVDYQHSFIRPHQISLQGILGQTGPTGVMQHPKGLTGHQQYNVCATTMPYLIDGSCAYVEDGHQVLNVGQERDLVRDNIQAPQSNDVIERINKTKERYGMEPIKPKEGLFDKIYGSLKIGPGESINERSHGPSAHTLSDLSKIVVRRNNRTGQYSLARKEYPEGAIPQHLAVYSSKFASAASECRGSINSTRGTEHVAAMKKCMNRRLVD